MPDDISDDNARWHFRWQYQMTFQITMPHAISDYNARLTFQMTPKMTMPDDISDDNARWHFRWQYHMKFHITMPDYISDYNARWLCQMKFQMAMPDDISDDKCQTTAYRWHPQLTMPGDRPAVSSDDNKNTIQTTSQMTKFDNVFLWYWIILPFQQITTCYWI
jgi:hypothetical protein